MRPLATRETLALPRPLRSLDYCGLRIADCGFANGYRLLAIEIAWKLIAVSQKLIANPQSAIRNPQFYLVPPLETP